MIPEFLGETRVFINTRPRRLAYLVRQTDYAQLRDAVIYATSEWGGFSQPILPVRRKRRIYPRWWQFAETLMPEVFIDYVGIEESLRAALARRFRASVIPPPMTGLGEPGVHTTVVHARDSLRGRTLLVPASASTLGEAMALGMVPDELRPPWQALGAPIEPVLSPAELMRGQTGAVPSPMWLTRAHTGVYQSEDFLGGPIIVFSDRMSPWRLLTFWNVRAAASSGFGQLFVLHIPLAGLADPEVGVELRELSLRQMSTPDVVFIGRDEARLRTIAELHGFQEGPRRTSIQLSAPERPRDLSEKPLTYRLNIDPRTWVMGGRKDGIRTQITVNVARPKLTVRADRTVPLQAFGGFIRTDIQGIEALDWPSSSAVANLVNPNAEFSDYGLSFLDPPGALVDKDLSVPNPDQVLVAFLGDRGWAWALSDKGNYVQALLGGLDAPRELPAFRSRLAIKTLFSLASVRRQKVEQTLRSAKVDIAASQLDELMRDLVSSGQQRWRTAADVASALGVSRKQLIKVFASLVADHLVQRGMGFECPRCNVTYSIPLERIQDHMRCDGCAFVSPVIGPNEEEPELRYALNSLLDRVLEQDCLGHLLTMRLVEREHGAVRLIPGALLRRSVPASEKEVDLLGLSRKQLIIGEVKSRSAAFTRAETKYNVDLADEIGARLLVLACLDEWSSDGKARAGAAGESRGVEVLTLGLSDLAPEA